MSQTHFPDSSVYMLFNLTNQQANSLFLNHSPPPPTPRNILQIVFQTQNKACHPLLLLLKATDSTRLIFCQETALSGEADLSRTGMPQRNRCLRALMPCYQEYTPCCTSEKLSEVTAQCEKKASLQFKRTWVRQTCNSLAYLHPNMKLW